MSVQSKNNTQATAAPVIAAAPPPPPVFQPPTWLKSELFDDLIKSLYPDSSRIAFFKVTSGSGAGENYATVLLRIHIEVEFENRGNKNVSFMLKLPHESEQFKKLMELRNICEIERIMYDTIIPEFEQLYKDAGVDIKFGAESLSIKAPTDYVLLSDLCTKGFKNANRLEGLDIKHTQCVLCKLAQWHAASAMRVATVGPYPENIATGPFNENSRFLIDQINISLVPQFLKACATYEGNELYIGQIKNLQLKLTDEIMKLAKVDYKEFNVLCHGDCWSNNIMFHYDAFGKIKDTYLIDYQTPRYASPANDLLYFLISSTKLEDKLTKFDDYVQYYHENLVEHLKLLNYPRKMPALRDIHASLFKYGLMGYMVAIGVMGGVLLDPTDLANIENVIGNTADGVNFKNLMYTNPRYRKHIQIVLPWLYKRGALE